VFRPRDFDCGGVLTGYCRQGGLGRFLFSTDEDFCVNGATCHDDNVVYLAGGAFSVSSLLPDGSLPPETNVDAFARLGPDDCVFSLAENAEIGGVLYAKSDLISNH
jgi:hypothetical protein